ncbi:unnamed protein product [Rotaria sp. Silwood2]|nr:unnamed protein product [Rotaria sp. Silwood2]CAF3319997.1 unnamed protein product [Rotaria sp. Silwood2]CAF3329553.1 unnamed protein product [Rotaria sp. Silwood2]CAF4370207.1 unnamed protein product [Rotaria sp. Silwood2]CAF4398594.1 unnamed protein product [Rotaria sp. Silwood2]
MPVTTRAAALRSQIAEETTSSTKPVATNKTIRKCRSQIKQKQLKAQSPEISTESEKHSSVVQQLAVPQVESEIEIDNHRDPENKRLIEGIDISIESLFIDQVLTLSPTSENKIGEQQINKKLASSHSGDHQSTILSSSPVTPSVMKSPTLTVEKVKIDYSLLSSDQDEDDIYPGDSNAIMNKTVEKGEIISGTSTRGGKMIFMNDYGYLFMNETQNTVGWRCARRDLNCKAVIYTFKNTQEFSHWNGQVHSHLRDTGYTRKYEILSKIKSLVIDVFIPIKAIIEDEYRKAKLTAEEKRVTPLPTQIESGLYKLRRKRYPPIPTDQKFIIPAVYQETYSNSRFLIYDKRKSSYGGRLLIFASDEQLNVLFHSEVLFADGTFKVSPTLFEQLYVLHGLQNGEVMPVCFILTSNRKYDTYTAIFRSLKRTGLKMGFDLKPSTIICDFEQSFMNAVTNELPQTTVTGCWFHFCQSCYRNIQKLGMMNLYEADAESRELLRGFMGLALLPIGRIFEGYEILKQRVTSSSQRKELNAFVSYFEHEWMHVFKPSTWSVNRNTWRTNNHAEAQNKRIFTRVVQPHPHLWRFIQCLKQEESVISHRMVQTGLGFSSIQEKKSTRKAARKSKQIQKLLHLLESKARSLDDTIKSFAHLVGEPVCRGRKGKKKKNNVSTSDLSILSSDEY